MEDLTAGCSIGTHTFEEILQDTSVTFHIIRLKECLFIWIGDSGTFDNLAIAMKTPYSSLPVSTSLMGYFGDSDSCSLAEKLCKKMGKQVLASFNLSKSDSQMLLLVHKRIMEEVTKYPEKF